LSSGSIGFSVSLSKIFKKFLSSHASRLDRPAIDPQGVRFIHRLLHGYPNIMFPKSLVRRPDLVIARHFAVIS
jgi:hypothetical protein